MIAKLNESEEPVISSFMDIAVQGLTDENIKIQQAPDREDENKHKGVHLAHAEECYGYLIRRAMVLKGHPYRFQYELPFPAPSRKQCDLVLSSSQSNGGDQWGVEMKWVSNRECFPSAYDDAEKLATSIFQRKFLLLFPMTDWTPGRPATDLTDSLLEYLKKRASLIEIVSKVERRFPITYPKIADFILLLLELKPDF